MRSRIPELAIPACFSVTCNPFLNVLPLSSSALTVLLAAPAEVSVAREQQTMDANSTGWHKVEG